VLGTLTQHHNPIELFATNGMWTDDRLTVCRLYRAETRHHIRAWRPPGHDTIPAQWRRRNDRLPSEFSAMDIVFRGLQDDFDHF
jgi:hypothetical protein